MLHQIKRRLSQVRKVIRTRTLLSDWRKFRNADHKRLRASGPKRVIVLPSDPFAVVGAKGDEAMLCSVTAWIKESYPDAIVDLITHPRWTKLPEELTRAGTNGAVPIWDSKWNLKTFIEIFKYYDALIIIGADVMDGYYSPAKSLFLFILADVASQMGLVSLATGYSFNREPPMDLGKAIQELSSGVNLFVRDQVSWERFTAISNGRGELVADVAFLLKPETRSDAAAKARQWIANRRAHGDVVIGFNIHSALLLTDKAGQKRILASAIAAMTRIFERGNISVILLPHDYRSTHGDLKMLKPVYEALKASFPEKQYLAEAEYSASELKQIAGDLDVVFAGRMHLSIAALGMGVPVGWATYQDKFEGLAQHFGVPDWLLLSPIDVQDHAKLHGVLARLIDERQALRSQVETELPRIKKLALKNLEPLSAL